MSDIRCFNCIDEVYMDDEGDGMYRCPVCGDEYDVQGDYEDLFDEIEIWEECCCHFCNCSEMVLDGGVCNDCLHGVHQG